jgi:hypothetical protein
VVKADKRVTITSSTSAKLTKTVQLFLEAEWTVPPVSTELCPPVARRMRNCITQRHYKIAINAEDVQLCIVHFNTNQSGTILPKCQECMFSTLCFTWFCNSTSHTTACLQTQQSMYQWNKLV